GQIRRGQGERLRAVIMASDLRDFTTLSDRLSGDAIIELIDDYFDAIGVPIGEHRGEILNFTGDGLLAIFTSENGQEFSSPALHALEAAQCGIDRLGTLNEQRRQTGRLEIRAGIALHFGEVIYGNVGAPIRLDFTAIGPAVNLAARIEGLTKQLMRPLLTSHAFAEICPCLLVSMGFHPIRGLSEPAEVFGLPE